MERLNFRGGTALIASTWMSWMQYRSFFFILAFGWMVPPLVSLFVWLAATAGEPIGGYTPGEFVSYYLTLVLVNQITYSQANWTMGDVIREGSLNFWLTKPMPAIWNLISSEAAGKTVTLVFVFPIVVILALVLRPELDSSFLHAMLALTSLALAWALRFLWGYWLALLAFWSSRADGLLAVQDALVFVFSGILAPVALLPGNLERLARTLPFHYMVGFPVEILVRGPETSEIAAGFATQLSWLAVALALSFLLWRLGLRRYSAVGG